MKTAMKIPLGNNFFLSREGDTILSHLAENAEHLHEAPLGLSHLMLNSIWINF